MVLTKFLKYTAEGRDQEMKGSGYKPTHDSIGYYKLYASDKMELRKMKHKFSSFENRMEGSNAEKKTDSSAIDDAASDEEMRKEFEEYDTMGFEPGTSVGDVMRGEEDEVNEFGIRKRRRERLVNLDHLLDDAEQFLMGKRVKGFGELSNRKTSNPFRVMNDMGTSGSGDVSGSDGKESEMQKRFGALAQGMKSDKSDVMGNSSLAAGYAPDESYREKKEKDKLIDEYAKMIFDEDVILSPNAPQGSTDAGQLPPNFPVFSKEEDHHSENMQLTGVSESFHDDDDPFFNASVRTSKKEGEIVDEDVYDEEEYEDIDDDELYEDVYLSEEAVQLYRTFLQELDMHSEREEEPPSYLPHWERLMWNIDQDELFELCEGSETLLQTDASEARQEVPIDNNPSEVIQGKMLREYYQLAKAGDVQYSFGKHPVSGRITRKRISFDTDVYRLIKRTETMQRAMEEMQKRETVSETVDQIVEKLTGKKKSEMTEEEIEKAEELMNDPSNIAQMPELQELQKVSTTTESNGVEEAETRPMRVEEAQTDGDHNTPITTTQQLFAALSNLPEPGDFKELDSDAKSQYMEHINHAQRIYADMSPEKRKELVNDMVHSSYEENKLHIMKEMFGNDNLTHDQAEMLEADENLMQTPAMQQRMQSAHGFQGYSQEIGRILDQVTRQSRSQGVDLKQLSREKFGIDLGKVFSAFGANGDVLGTSEGKDVPVSTRELEEEVAKMQPHVADIGNDKVLDLMRQQGANDEMIRNLQKVLESEGKKMW